MNEFKYHMLLKEHQTFNNNIDMLVESIRPTLTTDIIALAEAIEDFNTIVTEAELTPDQVQKLFTSASEIRGEGKGLITKGSEVAGAAAKKVEDMMAKIKGPIKSAVAKSKKAIPPKTLQQLEAGGESATKAKDFIDQKINDALVSAESAIRQHVPGGEKIVAGVNKLAQSAKNNPKTAAVAIAVLSALAGAASGGALAGAAGGAITKFILNTGLGIMQGEKPSQAAKGAGGKLLKGAIFGGLGGGLADWLGGVFADVPVDDVDAGVEPEAEVEPEAGAEDGETVPYEMNQTEKAMYGADAAQQIADSGVNPAAFRAVTDSMLHMQSDDVSLGNSTLLDLALRFAEENPDGFDNLALKDEMVKLERAAGAVAPDFSIDPEVEPEVEPAAEVEPEVDPNAVNPGNDKANIEVGAPPGADDIEPLDPATEPNAVNPGNDKANIEVGAPPGADDIEPLEPDADAEELARIQQLAGVEPSQTGVPGTDAQPANPIQPGTPGQPADAAVDAPAPSTGVPGTDAQPANPIQPGTPGQDPAATVAEPAPEPVPQEPEAQDVEDELANMDDATKAEYKEFLRTQHPEAYAQKFGEPDHAAHAGRGEIDNSDPYTSSSTVTGDDGSSETLTTGTGPTTYDDMMADNKTFSSIVNSKEIGDEPNSNVLRQLNSKYRQLTGMGMTPDQINANYPNIYAANRTNFGEPWPTAATESIDYDEVNRLREMVGLAPIAVVNEGPLGDMAKKAKDKVVGAAKKVGQKVGLADKGAVGVDEIQQAYADAGNPSDSEAITNMLKGMGFSGGEIKKAYKAAGITLEPEEDQKLAQQAQQDKQKDAQQAAAGGAGTGGAGGALPDEHVTKLANAVKKAGLQQHVVDHLAQTYQITEGFVFEDIVVEKLLSDKAVKQVIVKLVKQSNLGGAAGAEQQNSAGNVNDYVKKLKAEIDSAKGGEIPVGTELNDHVWKGKQWVNKNGQMAKKEVGAQLTQKAKQDATATIRDRVKEIVTFMADRKGQPEWENAAATVKQLIQDSGLDPKMAASAITRLEQGKTMERKMFNLVNKLLEHVGVSMLDLGIKAYTLNENRVVFCKSRKVDSGSIVGLLETLNPPLGRMKRK